MSRNYLEIPKPEVLVDLIRKKAERVLDDRGFDYDKGCVYYAMAANIVLGLYYGKNNIYFQAGTAAWPIIRPEEDDKIRMTHFSYQFGLDDPISQRLLKLGIMPEMHCWNIVMPRGVPLTEKTYLQGIVVDTTLKDQPRRIKEYGLTLTIPYPDFIFAKPEDVNRECGWGDDKYGARYSADPDAIAIAVRGIQTTTKKSDWI